MSAPRMTLADATTRRTPLARVLAAVEGATRLADGTVRARCELHGDRGDLSLHVTTADDGTVALACDAGCDVALILAALGLHGRDLGP